ncbi:hypothetical protein [Pseudofrankia saprophytica]|uniref:hypothetical protein n=1 Tax=Pseudofrankia saprophytica TaxID=298655 RepID=UPI0012FF58F4|nr:hypothetical protein [Pseudofrankia saprophytica]
MTPVAEYVPAWIQAFGVTAGFAGIYLQQQKNRADTEKDRSEKLEAQKIQARLVSVVFTAPWDYDGHWGATSIQINNETSPYPLFEVTISLIATPPGHSAQRSEINFPSISAGEIADRTPEGIFPIKGLTNRDWNYSWVMRFTDFYGKRWIKDSSGMLREEHSKLKR